MRLRSLLFVPGDSEKKFAKAGGIGADVLILDLEDSVAPSMKEAARAQVAALLVLGVRARGLGVGVEVGLAAQLHDPLGKPVGVRLFLARVFQELGLDRVGQHPGRGVVVAHVAQHAHPFGGQRGVQQLDDFLAVGAVGGGDGAVLDALARASAQGGGVAEGGGRRAGRGGGGVGHGGSWVRKDQSLGRCSST